MIKIGHIAHYQRSEMLSVSPGKLREIHDESECLLENILKGGD